MEGEGRGGGGVDYLVVVQVDAVDRIACGHKCICHVVYLSLVYHVVYLSLI